MKVKILKLAEDEGLPAIMEVNSTLIEAMDCTGYDASLKEGHEADLNFRIGLEDEDETLNEILRGNLEKKQELVSNGGWSYRAYGKVESINPTVINCGIITFNDEIELNDPELVNKYVGFNILRLDVWAS